MSKSKNNLDLNIKREVTPRIITLLTKALDKAIVDSSDEASRFMFTYQRDSFLSKYVDESTDSADVKRHRAIVKWLGVERRNKSTNDRLFNSDPTFNGVGSGWRLLLKAASYIEQILGRSPPEDILVKGSFSGGATTSRKRGPGCLFSKFVGSLDVTPECWSLLRPHVEAAETWATLSPEVLTPRLVKGNVMFTVPKTAIIDRVACKEPDGNIFCQKAVGDFIRYRLKARARIMLNDQSVNRELAHRGSITNGLATIDLSSASDSLSDSLVRILLPEKWYTLLDALRCRKTFIDGKSHVNEMFSSMGNGFTFELESLVFWALARSTCHLSGSRGRISVYGDDIIVPRSAAPMLIPVLNWVGFSVNVKKTFTKGPFRESCGGHYYRGLDVTPFYLRRPIKDVSDLILFLNQFRAWIIRTESDTSHGFDGSHSPFTELWLSLKPLVPRGLWGGWDLTVRTQLVTPDRPRLRLVPVLFTPTSLEMDLQTGLYLERLLSIESRVKPPTETTPSGIVVETTRWRLRRSFDAAWVFGIVRPLFYQEQGFGQSPLGTARAVG